MSGDYRRISTTRLWTDARIRELRRKSPDAHNQYVYLVTNPHTNISGMYLLPIQYAEADLTSSKQRIRKNMKVLEKHGTAYWDERAGVVYVPAVLQWDPLASLAQVQGAIRKLEALPPTSLLERFKEDISVLAQSNPRKDKDTGEPILNPLLRFLGLPEVSPSPQTGSQTPRVVPPSDPPRVSGQTLTPSHSPSQAQTQSPSPSDGNGDLNGKGSKLSKQIAELADNKSVPPVSPQEIRSEAARVYRRSLEADEVA